MPWLKFVWICLESFFGLARAQWDEVALGGGQESDQSGPSSQCQGLDSILGGIVGS